MGEREAYQNHATRKGHNGTIECHFAFLLIFGDGASSSQPGAQ
jgi:hypothetical protein